MVRRIVDRRRGRVVFRFTIEAKMRIATLYAERGVPGAAEARDRLKRLLATK